MEVYSKPHSADFHLYFCVADGRNEAFDAREAARLVVRGISELECSTPGIFISIRVGNSLRRLFAGLLANQVLGVPVRPIRISVTDAFFVLARQRRNRL